MQRYLILACALAFAGGLTGTALGSRAAGQPPAACQIAEVRTHDEAVFGHFATRAQALALARRAGKLGFRGIKIENEGCGDFEVEIDGADNAADRNSFAREAKKAGFLVTFEQTGPPMQPPKGQAVGVFARLRTIDEANTLMGRLAAVGFVFIDVARVGSRWDVVMPQVPVSATLSIAAEVHKAAFHIAFITG
jgi:hypothetical protein